MALEDREVTGVKEVELDLLGGMGYQGQKDPLVLEDFREEMDYPPLGPSYFHWVTVATCV